MLPLLPRRAGERPRLPLLPRRAGCSLAERALSRCCPGGPGVGDIAAARLPLLPRRAGLLPPTFVSISRCGSRRAGWVSLVGVRFGQLLLLLGLDQFGFLRADARIGHACADVMRDGSLQ